jgi:hypothetical protein
MNLPYSIKLDHELYLLAFADAYNADSIIMSESFTIDEILYRGNFNELMSFAEKFAPRTLDNNYADYYYYSQSLSTAHRSLQSAIWKIEDTCRTPNIFNYFLIIKRYLIN